MPKNLEKLLINGEKTILDAMKLINDNGMGLLLVANEDNSLLGTVTDGDIRRGILLGCQLNIKISEVCNKSCTFSYKDVGMNEVRNIFIEKKIKVLPIVDKDKKVIDYFVIDDLIDFNKLEKENPVLIMAGGLGTRLSPLTDNLPKPMLKVGDKPILQTIIEQFSNYGFKNILIAVNYKADIIEDYFRDGKDFGVSITYIKETERRGTAGAIKLAEDYLDRPFFVVNGDILTNLNFYDMLQYHTENDYRMTIGSRIYETQIPYGVLNIREACITSLEEKPVINYLVSGGIYVLSPEIICNIPKDKCFDITQLIDILVKNKERVGSFPIADYWMDIGKVEDYYKANNDLEKYF